MIKDKEQIKLFQEVIKIYDEFVNSELNESNLTITEKLLFKHYHDCSRDYLIEYFLTDMVENEEKQITE